MLGVNTPGHFVVSCPSSAGPLFVDPFSGGDVLDLCQCLCANRGSLGKQQVLCDAHFAPPAPRDIVARVLRNFKSAYAMQNCWPSARWASRSRLAVLLPQFREERRDLGLLYLRLGRPQGVVASGRPTSASAPAGTQALQPSIASGETSAEMN